MPDWQHYIRDHLPPLGVVPEREAEIVSELAQQLEQAFQAALASGADEPEARRRAEGEISDWPALGRAIETAEAPSAGRFRLPGGRMLGDVWRDLRLGARHLRSAPRFAFVVVLTLGLCLAEVTFTFSLVNLARWQVPPFPQADRIVGIILDLHGNPDWGDRIRAGDFADFRAGAPAFAQLAAYSYVHNYNLSGDGVVEHLATRPVTANYFNVLGVVAAQGRTFLPDADQPGHNHVVVLSDAFWRSRFAAAPMLGKSISLDGVPYVVVGIMPRGFGHGVNDVEAPLWVPWNFSRRTPAASGFVIGRLRSGATLAEAQAQVAGIALHEASVNPDEKGTSKLVVSLKDYLEHRDYPVSASGLFLILLLEGLILLIGCANVAGLGLGRAMARRDEMSVRHALGATRGRLVRQVLTETMLLTTLAGLCGLLLGWLAIRWFGASVGSYPLVIDARVLAATAAAVLVTALGSGLPAALHFGRRSRPVRSVTSPHRWRNLLVAAEIALAVACLVLIGVAEQEISHEFQQPLGFNADHVLLARMELEGSRYSTATAQKNFIAKFRAAAAALPGVRATALVAPPPDGWNEATVAVRGQPAIDWRGKSLPRIYGVTAGYFDTLRIPLLAGRVWSAGDTAPTAIVTRTAARHLFPDGTSPIGHYIRIHAAGEPWRQIVGEIGDVVAFRGDASNNGELFEPLSQAPHPYFGLMLRTAAGIPPSSLTTVLRGTLTRLDRTQALFGVEPLATRINLNLEGDAAFAGILMLLGAMALLLSTIGIYSIVAYAAVQRRREIAIRAALGASARQQFGLLVGGAARLTLIGLALGCGLGWLGLRLLAANFGDLHAHDLTLFAVPGLLLIITAFLASFLPARRAINRAPWSSLRYE